MTSSINRPYSWNWGVLEALKSASAPKGALLYEKGSNLCAVSRSSYLTRLYYWIRGYERTNLHKIIEMVTGAFDDRFIDHLKATQKIQRNDILSDARDHLERFLDRIVKKIKPDPGKDKPDYVISSDVVLPSEEAQERVEARSIRDIDGKYAISIRHVGAAVMALTQASRKLQEEEELRHQGFNAVSLPILVPPARHDLAPKSATSNFSAETGSIGSSYVSMLSTKSSSLSSRSSSTSSLGSTEMSDEENEIEEQATPQLPPEERASLPLNLEIEASEKGATTVNSSDPINIESAIRNSHIKGRMELLEEEVIVAKDLSYYRAITPNDSHFAANATDKFSEALLLTDRPDLPVKKAKKK